MAIIIDQLRMGRIGFKMAKYDRWCPFTNMTTADDSGQWAGLYISPTAEMSMGYAQDCLDENTGNGNAYLHIAHLLRDLNVLICDDPALGVGDTPGDQKARIVKNQLPPNIVVGDAPLIPSLGRLGYAFKSYHDQEGNMEIIIPNKLSAFVWMIRQSTLNYEGFFLKT